MRINNTSAIVLGLIPSIIYSLTKIYQAHTFYTYPPTQPSTSIAILSFILSVIFTFSVIIIITLHLDNESAADQKVRNLKIIAYTNLITYILIYLLTPYIFKLFLPY